MENVQPQGKHEPIKGERTIKAMLNLVTFVGKGDAKQDQEVNDFLKTIDNQNRFLNGRNAYSMGDKAVVQVWYLENIKDTPVVESFGKKNDKKSEK